MMIIMSKLLSVEIPTCEPAQFEKFYKTNFKYWSLIKDKIVINMNFQNCSDEQIKGYVDYIESLGLEIHYSKNDYSRPVKFLTLRENVHSNYTECPFAWIGDDDIAILSEKYINEIEKMLDRMVADESIGVCTIRRNIITERPIAYLDKTLNQCYTAGGILVRIIRPDKCLSDPKYLDLTGHLEDTFHVFSRLIEGYTRWSLLLPQSYYEHYEIRSERARGGERHGWDHDEQTTYKVVDEMAHILVDTYVDKNYVPKYEGGDRQVTKEELEKIFTNVIKNTLK